MSSEQWKHKLICTSSLQIAQLFSSGRSARTARESNRCPRTIPHFHSPCVNSPLLSIFVSCSSSSPPLYWQIQSPNPLHLIQRSDLPNVQLAVMGSKPTAVPRVSHALDLNALSAVVLAANALPVSSLFCNCISGADDSSASRQLLW